ncbi:inositol polyphosphate-5-phosphatase A [Synchiropus splendidus]|uniref:inositol polyphosphate-5-phosphatase A n=1 Tax=Synchiropus splendidus TaxID=270530 RepID=UPI00237D9F0C|nr:inositol polyphosphate-5-phosphatase A [Synchiropus splendidus]
METRATALLVTANVGSLFDNVGEIQSEWLRELYRTIHSYKPQFIAMHFQEVGGKEYMANMGHAEEFFRSIWSGDEMADYDRARIYVDNQFKAEETFTALGSMYCIHRTLQNVSQYDFKDKAFKAVSGRNQHVGSLDGVNSVEKEKFPKNFWPDFKWSRKGYMRTRWIIHDQGLDLVNVHLFHDASNLVACNSSPSIYSANRKNALTHVINRISDQRFAPLPFFLFGDFNFRLDASSLVQHLSTSADVQTVKKDSSNQVERIVCEEKDNDRKVLLQIEEKLFAYLHQAVFREDNGKALLQFDKEASAFHDVVAEEEIKFPPSYPYSEERTKPTQYMNTRCPAWCDRVLMSHSARQLIQKQNRGGEEKTVEYNTVGPNVCMGDHKPVYLFFSLKTNEH